MVKKTVKDIKHATLLQVLNLASSQQIYDLETLETLIRWHVKFKLY